VLFVELMTWVLLIYAVAGLEFAVIFVAWGVNTIDPASRGASIGFRLIIIPGVVALWPCLAWRWARPLGRDLRR
jgi:hypothetical protein